MSVATLSVSGQAAAPASLYRYYDRRGVVLYVGITIRGQIRGAEHGRAAEWWPYVVRQSVDHFASEAEVRRAEREMIRLYRPPFNKQHNIDHESLREAYLAIVAAEERWAAGRPQGFLLVPIESGAKWSKWTSRPEDSADAEHVWKVDPNRGAPVNSDGEKFGKVQRVEQVDGRLLVHLRHLEALPDWPWRLRVTVSKKRSQKWIVRDVVASRPAA